MPDSAADVLRARGFDVHTVGEENLLGAPDGELREVCRQEDRVIVTTDKDFTDIRAIRAGAAGIIVLRHKTTVRKSIHVLLASILDDLEARLPRGEIWIVEEGYVRRRKLLGFNDS